MGSWILGAGPASTILAGMLLAVVACSSSGTDAEESTGGETGGSPSDAAEVLPDEVAFEAPTMTMTPGETRAVTVYIKPAGEYRVRFALLGDADDASLDRAEVVSESDGAATVLLTAPSGPTETTFTIRASVGQSVATEAEVTIASQGSAALAVKPVYGGQRMVRGWFASAHPGVTCAELTGTPPPDGDLKVETTLSFVPTLEVPAGRDLAVTVRGDYQVGGCLDVPPLAVNEARTVEVDASDVPVQLAGVTLDLRLALSQPWAALADTVTERLETALLAESDDDVDALLDAIAELLAADHADVDPQVRGRGGWDGALVSQFGETSATVMRDAIREWYGAGAGAMSDLAWLDASLEPATDVRDKAYLTPVTFADRPAGDMGFPEELLVSWLAEPNDKVLLGARFGWVPWVALTQAAEGEASRSSATELDIPTALVEQIDCDATASNLHTRALEYMGSCDLDCLASVCEEAIVGLWARASGAVAADEVWLDLSVAAAATVDDHASITAFTGEWVGTLDTGATEAPVSGGAEGWASEDDSTTR